MSTSTNNTTPYTESPGEHASPTTPLDPSSYALKAVNMTAEALAQNTFAVAGVLLDSTGKVWQAVHNNVIEDDCISDPTAHGERQILSWYLQQRARGAAIPPPEQMTIVTSLDPCVMCTGAFLASGVNVATVSLDDRAGVNYTDDGKLLTIPAAMRNAALNQFSYLGLQGCPGRAFAGSPSSVFFGQSIPQAYNATSVGNFIQSAQKVQQILDGLDPAPTNILSPSGATALSIAKKFYPAAAALKVDFNSTASLSALRAAMILVSKMTQSPSGLQNAAALIDPFGNVLMITSYKSRVFGGTELDTPFMVLTQNYGTCRKLTRGLNGAFPHPKRCKWVLLEGPSNTLETDLMDIGAYGSTMEGPLPDGVTENLYYFEPQQTTKNLAEMIKALPPLYSKTISINPVQLRTVRARI